MVKEKNIHSKTPIFKNAYIPGAKFDIKQNGKVIKTVTSKTDFIEVDLPLGKYQVEEEKKHQQVCKNFKKFMMLT